MDIKSFRLFRPRHGIIVRDVKFIFWYWCYWLLCQTVSSGEFRHGYNFHVRNAQNNLCLTSNSNSFRTEVGVFLGQVTLEDCDFDSAKQKWGIILWSKENGRKQYWFYPKENGLNELTAVLSEDGVYPVNNFIDVLPVDGPNAGGRYKEERFIFKSLEFGQCAASQGRDNPISYDSCDIKRKDQQWMLERSPDEPITKSISGRSFIGLTIDFMRFTLQQFLFPSSPKN